MTKPDFLLRLQEIVNHYGYMGQDKFLHIGLFYVGAKALDNMLKRKFVKCHKPLTFAAATGVIFGWELVEELSFGSAGSLESKLDVVGDLAAGYLGTSLALYSKEVVEGFKEIKNYIVETNLKSLWLHLQSST